MLETHGDSDERGGSGERILTAFCFILGKNDCWSPIRYTVPEVYFIPGKNPAFPSSIRFYPINEATGGSFCSVSDATEHKVNDSNCQFSKLLSWVSDKR